MSMSEIVTGISTGYTFLASKKNKIKYVSGHAKFYRFEYVENVPKILYDGAEIINLDIILHILRNGAKCKSSISDSVVATSLIFKHLINDKEKVTIHTHYKP